MMILEQAENMAAFLQENPESWMVNFSDKLLGDNRKHIGTLLVGAEGGFSDEECDLIDKDKIIGLDTPLILKSESAACAVASKVLI